MKIPVPRLLLIVAIAVACSLANAKEGEPSQPDPKTVWDLMNSWDQNHPYRHTRMTISSPESNSVVDSYCSISDFGTEAFLLVTSPVTEYWIVNTPLDSFAFFPRSGITSKTEVINNRASEYDLEVWTSIVNCSKSIAVEQLGVGYRLHIEWDPSSAADLGFCNAQAKRAFRTYHIASDGFVERMESTNDDTRTLFTSEIITLKRDAVVLSLPSFPNSVDLSAEPDFEEAVTMDQESLAGLEPH